VSDNSNAKTRLVTKVCEYCGREFSIPWHKAARRTYCSRECTIKAVRRDIIPGRRPAAFKENHSRVNKPSSESTSGRDALGGTLDKQIVKGADDPKNRDLRIVKTCETCGALYHPRKNSYQIISRFCSQECARKARRGSRGF
jgi:hypothetical protein